MIDKKIITVFLVITIVAAGTAIASTVQTSTITRSVSIGDDVSFTATKTTTNVDSSSRAPVVIVPQTHEADLAAVMLRLLGITVRVDEITTYRTRNMGYGEIVLAYNLAHQSGRSVGDILYMRHNQKMGWGKIAKALGVRLNGAADNTVLVLREANLIQDADDFRISIRVDLDNDDEREYKHLQGIEPGKDDDGKDRWQPKAVKHDKDDEHNKGDNKGHGPKNK